MRTDGRKYSQLRPLELIPEVLPQAEGSVEIRLGQTRVICTATVENTLPKWLMGSGKGWITAEYGMLPRSTHQRIQREKAFSGGRTQEISRLIGRSMRAATDLTKLGERQIIVDCDVIQADGGTRTAAITGGFVALSLALKFLTDQKMVASLPLKNYVSAVSVGLRGGHALLDLNYDEDSTIDTDMNIVMNENNDLVEIQGTAENSLFSVKELDDMVKSAQLGCAQLFAAQAQIVGSFFPLKR